VLAPSQDACRSKTVPHLKIRGILNRATSDQLENNAVDTLSSKSQSIPRII